MPSPSSRIVSRLRTLSGGRFSTTRATPPSRSTRMARVSVTAARASITSFALRLLPRPRAFRGLEFPFAFGDNPAAFLEDGLERLFVLFRRHHRRQILFKFFLRHRLAVDVEKFSGVAADLAVEPQIRDADFRPFGGGQLVGGVGEVLDFLVIKPGRRGGSVVFVRIGPGLALVVAAFQVPNPSPVRRWRMG